MHEKTSSECCGRCVQWGCLRGEGDVATAGETWQSEDGCSTVTCQSIGGGQVD